jgi:hypothetical protein
LELGDENQLPVTIAPAGDGGSAPIHVPQGTIVSALQLRGGTLSIWYRRVNDPVEFNLGDEVKGQGPENTREPPNNGGGNAAFKDGYTMTGFQWLKDHDGQLTLFVWYRRVTEGV